MIDHFHLKVTISSRCGPSPSVSLSAPVAICLQGEKYRNDLNVKYRNNHLLTKSHLFQDSGAFPFLLLSFASKKTSAVDCFVFEGNSLLGKMLNFVITFSLLLLSVHIYPKLWDNVIRDGVLYVSYQFSFKEPFALRFHNKMPPGVLLKSFSLRKLDWRITAKNWN